MQLTFETLRNTIDSGLNWYLLIPKELEELQKMHKKVLTIIKNPKSKSYPSYDPHLTLLNSRDLEKTDNENKLDSEIKMPFVIAITDRDKIGQATKVIRCNHLNPVENISSQCSFKSF
jgi:hypothetical protein